MFALLPALAPQFPVFNQRFDPRNPGGSGPDGKPGGPKNPDGSAGHGRAKRLLSGRVRLPRATPAVSGALHIVRRPARRAPANRLPIVYF